jgi:hypothetical protein
MLPAQPLVDNFRRAEQSASEIKREQGLSNEVLRKPA